MRKLILLLFFANQAIFAQFTTKFQEPKSPEIANFERYGNTPISEYNGRINFNIPLHTIKYGDIEVPLSINYNSNGIRVDEESTEVGLGWNFGIGTITQTINGKDDLNSTFKLLDYYSTPYPQAVLTPNPYWHFISYPVGTGDPRNPARISLTSATPDLNKYSIIRLQDDGPFSNTIYFPRNNNELVDIYGSIDDSYFSPDIELDLFSANFFGHTIIFYKNPENANDFIVLDNSKYKITKIVESIVANSTITSWKIITPDGFEYYFQERNYTNSESNILTGGYIENITPYSYSNSNQGFPDKLSTVSWKITKIKDTKGNEINFEYEQLPILRLSNKSSGNTDFYNVSGADQFIRWNCSNYFGYIGPFNNNSDLLYSGKGISTKMNSSLTAIQSSILKKITYGDNTVTFNNESRTDLPNGKRFDNIIVKNKNIIIKNILFNNSLIASNSNPLNSRMLLNGLSIDDKKYIFEYNSSNAIPSKDSNAYDYWGFYNGATNTSPLNNPFRLYKNYNDIPEWARSFISQLEGKSNRSAHPSYCKIGILEKITYPTGGYTKIDYELNEFDNYFFPDYNNKVGLGINNTFATDYLQINSKGYGLRIKKIIDYVSPTEYYEKKYTYTGGKHIPSFVQSNPDYHNVYRYNSPNTSADCPTYNQSYGPKITSYFSNIYQSNVLNNVEGVGYDKVTIENMDKSGNSQGKTVKYYTNVPDVNARQKFGQMGQPTKWFDEFGYSIRNTDIDNGLLLNEEIYDKQNKLKQKMDYYYSQNLYKNTVCYSIKKGYIGRFLSSINDFYNEYLLYYYPLKKMLTLPTGKLTTDYLDSGSLIKREITNYNGYNIPSGKTISIGNKEVYRENSSMLYTPFLLAKNQLNVPQNTVISEDGQNKSYTEYEYIETPNVLQLKKQHNSVDLYPNAANKTTIFYDSYDEKNNLTQYHRDGDINVSIIWGYNKTLPVAKIENIAYSAIQPSIITAIQQASDSNNEVELLNQLTNLRSTLSTTPNVMITTYTHKPLIGLSTIIDPKGDKKTFEYDSFNKLKYVKDKDGNILSENEYHFRPQN